MITMFVFAPYYFVVTGAIVISGEISGVACQVSIEQVLNTLSAVRNMRPISCLVLQVMGKVSRGLVCTQLFLSFILGFGCSAIRWHGSLKGIESYTGRTQPLWSMPCPRNVSACCIADINGDDRCVCIITVVAYMQAVTRLGNVCIINHK